MKTLLKNMLRPMYHYIKNKNEREFTRLYSKWGGFKRFEMQHNVKFLNYTFDVPDMQSFVWQFKDIFVDEDYKFITSSVRPVILDCGSNVGTSLLYFAENFPNAKIIGFEADSMIANISKENLSRNGITNVKVINKAVWVNSNGIDFSIEGADGGSIKGSNNLKKIESIRLRDFLQSENIVDLLKIDIEGAESDVLIDCADSLFNVKKIFVEYHSWSNIPQNLSNILEILESNNFRYYIEGINKRKLPFLNKEQDKNMDLQLNIFAYKLLN